MRERENLFNDFLGDLRKREKDEKHQKKEQVSFFLHKRIHPYLNAILIARMEFHPQVISAFIHSWCEILLLCGKSLIAQTYFL